ncbi:ATP-binding protein [Stieleria sp. JC731]|nr:ATP-binding protein [Stieleria sp. JC731]
MEPLIEKWTNRLLPAHYAQGDTEQVRVGRLAIFLSLLVFLAGCVYSVIYLALGLRFASIGPAQAIFTVPIAVWLFRRSQSIRLAGNLLACICTVGVGVVVVCTGGVSSSALPWFFFGPLVSMMVAGRRSGIAWYAVAISVIGSMLALGETVTLPASEIPESFRLIHSSVVAGGLITVVTLTAWSFGLTQEIAARKLTLASSKAELARRDAETAHAEALLVLDNVTDGLAVVSLNGDFVGKPSARFQEWFGCPLRSLKIWDCLQIVHKDFAESLELHWEQISSDWMPLELALDQLPNDLQVDGWFFRLTYRPVMVDGELQHILVICTDTTAEREAEYANEIQKEQLAIFTRFVRDPKSLRDFLSEADRLVSNLGIETAKIAEQKRWVHTLKGNCAIFGLEIFANWLHRLEDELVDEENQLGQEQRDAIAAQWMAIRSRLETIVDIGKADHVMIEKDVFESTVHSIETGCAGPQLAAKMRRWTWDRVNHRLELLAERATNLGERLGKSGIHVQIEVEDVRRPPCPDWNAFWGSVIHVVRNAIDHGIEHPQDRIRIGKRPAGSIMLRAWEDHEQFVFEVSDDGAGIDWNRVSQKCLALGMRCDSEEDLQAAVFADGLSTKDQVSEVSGRGVGMAAVREACEILDGQIEIESTLGSGTKFRFTFPIYSANTGALTFHI